MSQDVELGCRCGNVGGRLRNAAPDTVNHAICYCDDCQAFLYHLGRSDLLDAQGGTDIVQAAPASISFDRGTSHIIGVRLSPKGMYRWYASCCNTPLGNTMSPSIPFVGMGPELFRGAADAEQRQAIFGESRGASFGQYAIGSPPQGSTKLNLGLIVGALGRVLGWKLRGKTWPHPFFDRSTGKPNYPFTTLSPAERAALRPLCGPNPTAGTKS